ncbi:cell division protein FtsQ/DivIB [Kiritimatiella glycovorans]|uniref:Cell division protein FtsQ n=1 Tax=Kiritimatiella glycovorans TaxID=1307763 RepID=A0A0G3EHS6_9BACT|nr:FtsQ-type POTRA domain-containing protein [Kiritimatiella glycovorans]AKJ63744.1 Cell division protein FtsQ [Kiritimatiella glycovorans]
MARRTVSKKKRRGTGRASRRGKGGSGAGRVFVAVVFAAVVILAVWGCVAGVRAAGRSLFAGNGHFRCREIRVSTDGRLDRARILEYGGLKDVENIFEPELGKVLERLSTVPMIESVTVSRDLPGTLLVDVRERVAVARLGGGGPRRYPLPVDRFGVVLPPRRNSDKLPEIRGLEENDRRTPGDRIEGPAMERALRLLDILRREKWGAHIDPAVLDVSGAERIELRLRNRVRVLLPPGRESTLLRRLRRLVAILQIAEDHGRALAEVDLTADGINVPVTYR